MAVTQAGEREYRCFLGFVEVNLAVSWQFTIVARPGQKRHLLRAAVLLFSSVFCGLIWRNLSSLRSYEMTELLVDRPVRR